MSVILSAAVTSLLVIVGLAQVFAQERTPVKRNGSVMKTVGTSPAEGTNVTMAAWDFRLVKDQMSDKLLALWWLPASDNGGLHVEAYLRIQCSHGNDIVWVSTGTGTDITGMKSHYRGTLGTLTGDIPVSTVNLRFDSEKRIAELWEKKGDYKDLYAPNGKKMIKKLIPTKTMLFLFTELGGKDVIYRFDVGGLSKYENELKSECKY